ncbi:MAG: type IV pilus modification PilV family protein [Minisyncoccia bacterium]|jgi:hypothetical protein
MKVRQLQSQQQGKSLQSKSQSIVEIFLVLLVFSIAFISLVILVNNYLKILKTAKDRIIANFLAQEGLELVIAKRNINKVKGSAWLEGLNYDSFCIDINLNLQQSNIPCSLYLDSNNQFVHSNTPTLTPFSRLIKLNTSTNIATVTSEVIFDEDQKVELETVITDWLP